MNRITAPAHFLVRLAVILPLLGLVCRGQSAGESAPNPADKIPSHGSSVCTAADDYFLNDVWTKVGAQSCLKCHKTGGDAEDSKFILQDPSRDPDPARAASLRLNREAFAAMAALGKGGESRLLVKASGGLDHGGEEVLKPDSSGYRILAEYVQRQTNPPGELPARASKAENPNATPFFEGITMLDDRRLLRRAALSLAARLPTAQEVSAVQERGLAALGPVLDAMMKEDAFYERLAEAFNDVFLVRGYDDGAESALSYDHFSETRHWTQKHNLDQIADKDARQKARYKLDDDYREALLQEPLELIKYIVRGDRPFTEIATADYIMVTPYTARGYGIYDDLRPKFKNPDDPFEYIPVRLKALKSRERNGRGNQKSETGFYPHAGMLSIFQYLRRYPTTETNRNRLRARMYYQHFLGVDVLELAARVTDAAAVTAKYEVPTMQAAECVVCHKTLDPVAGIFQDYYSLEGVFGPRKDGWFKDMFGPGFEGEDLPENQHWRSLAWLADRTVKDPRFATTMVEHVYYVLTGRKTLLPSKAIDDPLFAARQRAYHAQRREVERIAARFVKTNFNLKEVFKEWITSSFYRADGLETAAANPQREAELADIGLARMLSPEQLERKVSAIFGKPWGRLKDQEYALLYGGIDSKEVTERAADPSGAMGALQRTLADEVACKNVAPDFAKEPEKRRLFPDMEPDVLPGESAEADQRIRGTITHLHQLLLGHYDSPGSPAVYRTFALFSGILSDAKERKGIDDLENYHCRAAKEERFKDPRYTVRAWRGVVTYLLRQRDFLYE